MADTRGPHVSVSCETDRWDLTDLDVDQLTVDLVNGDQVNADVMLMSAVADPVLTSC